MSAASFSLFHKKGVKVDFSLPFDCDPVAYVADIQAAIDTALVGGWSVDKPEVVLGEDRIIEVDAWAWASSSNKGKDQIHLFSPGKLHKVCKPVYEEDFAKLPILFDPKNPGKIKQMDSGNNRERAAQRGYLNACAPFTIRAVDTGTTYATNDESGEAVVRAVYEFDAVVSMSEEAQRVMDQKTGKANGQAGQAKATPATTTGQNGAVTTGQNGAGQAGQNGAGQAKATPATTTGQNGAGQTELTNADLLALQIKTLFGDIDDRAVLEATPWLIKRWSKHFTPDNVRNQIPALSVEECGKVAESCVAYPTKLVNDFKAWRKEEQAKATQAKGEKEKQLADIPF